MPSWAGCWSSIPADPLADSEFRSNRPLQAVAPKHLQKDGSIYRKTCMDTKRLEERLGTNRLEDTSTTSAQAIFRERSQFLRTIEPILGHIRGQRYLVVALIAAGVLVVLTMGYAIGGGFSATETASIAPPSGDVFITTEQADLLRQQSVDLQEARSSLAIAEGESAFLRSQIATLSDDTETLRRSFNETQVELVIIVGIYEECLKRLYPVACIEDARPVADAFLAELYAETP